MIDRQVALINDQTDIWDALADAETAEETVAEVEQPTDEHGEPVLFALPAAPAAEPVGEQLVIDLSGGEHLERHGTVTYAVRVDEADLACYRPAA
ncbi:hypothetical protein [Thermomonospora cellulosilytica]|uniref:Uncharacterized protein n=1 Tax=Thermomonospora cellulosilytica TaxID=1411118 RepID=A0A7W3MXP4_9ACTN|nr:hypothetical protein [Thermomonospora cellulosilytica]MBA9003741.1 hypothetical protein [Thermomonospora cellulosilytica]